MSFMEIAIEIFMNTEESRILRKRNIDDEKIDWKWKKKSFPSFLDVWSSVGASRAAAEDKWNGDLWKIIDR